MDILELLDCNESAPVEILIDELMPLEETEPPKGVHTRISMLLNTDQTMYSYEDHLAALEGPALDPVHLYLRSGLPVKEHPEHHAIMAAILKARCDYQYFKPLVEEGLTGRFSGYYDAFRECLRLLETYVPPRGSDLLGSEWDQAWNLIEGALPVSERHHIA